MRTAGVFAALLLVSCFNDSTGPGERRRAGVAFQPVFDRRALALVAFDRVHITLVRAGVSEPQVALDTTVSFPSDQDSIRIPLSVPLAPGATSETFELRLEMLDAGGAVVFRGGPVPVTASVLGSQAPDVPMSYVGVGANAAGVRFRAPVPALAFFGDTVQFAAEAYDSAGSAIGGTPILYLVDPADSARARVPDPALGRVVANAVRGPAAVVARLLTGQTARTTLTLQPRPGAISWRSGSGQSAIVGAALAQPIVARVTGADGLAVQGVTVTFATPSGGGSFSPGTAATDVNGDASTTWTLGSVVGAQTATASAGAVVSGVIGATGTPASASRLAFLVQPATATAGTAIAAVQVAAQDAFGNLYPSFTGTVTVGLGANPGEATLSGPTAVAAVAGVATFSGLSLDKAGAGYTLVASASGLTGATSAGFPITAAAPATLALASGGSQTAAANAQLPQPVVVQVADAFGNGVSGRQVTFAVATGGGSVGTPVATTDASGLASTVWTLGPLSGAQTITATATGLAGSPLTVTATATGGIASTTVTPRASTLTALGQTVQLAAQAKDGSGANVSGSFTWASRTPTAATVNASGLVTAVANGASYVVVTEAGGTRDSALVTVAQTVATVNVTPGTRSLYLGGRFTFAAQAVDGRGNPVPGSFAYTWSSTAPAVATVDTAGHVTAVGLGSAQIRATSGTSSGVANVGVLTPITRIAVVVDTVGAAATDTFTMTSLGLTRRYRAVAHDTLDAVMTGLTFLWQSSNGSVAQIPAFADDTARVVSAANGVTEIRATAQGFTSAPGASLTVAQVLAAVALTPPTATIAVTGTVGLIARGLDANGRFIAGGAFTFASGTPAVATVDAASGVVTGVALGSTDITASSGAITSNPSVIVVGASVPPLISFGRDTVSVGRGASAPIPILLSTPPTRPLTVNLTATAFAHWSAASIVIPTGQTAANATLVGDSAGTTIVAASDGSDQGYAGAAAVAKVTANMRLASGSYGINATDVVPTQVLLSDPSPAGGTFVTFSYSTPGVAAISPDPALIPQGQLAADIQIRGVGAGSTSITPVAIGVNGTPSSFTASAPVLRTSQTVVRLGQGQYEPNVYVYTPTYTNVPVPVTVTSSDTNVVAVTPSLTVPAGSYYAYMTITARAAGTASLSLTAPGWTASSTVAVTVSSPYLGVCCSNSSLFTTSPQQNVTVYSEDSTRSSHYRANSLVVHLRSTDTTIIRLLDTLVTIEPGSYYTNGGRFVMGGLAGSAYIVASAGGHQSDSSLYAVNGPPLTFSWGGTPNIGAGQQEPNYYVYTPNYLTAPLVVTLSSSDTAVASVPATVTIPTNSYYAYFTLVGKVPGSVTIHATAPGYNAVNGSLRVTSPRLYAAGGGTINNFGPGASINVYSADSAGSVHVRTAPLAVSVLSTDTTVVKLDSASVTIPAGQYYTPSGVHVTPVGTGTAQVIFAAPGHPLLDTLTFTVVSPQVQFSFTAATLGQRQHFDPNGNGFYVYTPDYRSSPLAVTLTQRNGRVDSLSVTALSVPASSYYAYADAYGLATGVDTLIVTAAGYRPDTAFVTVTTPRFTSSGLPGSTTTTNPPLGINVYTTDSVGTSHYAMDTVVVAAASSDSAVLQPALGFVRVLKNQYYVTTAVNVVGPGAANLTYADSAGTGYGPATTNVVTVTGPALALANGSPVLGMRQHGGANSSYVYVPNNVATPLVVHLVSTGPRVATVAPDSVIIPAGSYYAYFDVTAQDTVGTIQIQAAATGYGGAAMNVQVTQPRFTIGTSTQLNTTGPRSTVTVYATDVNGTTHYATEDVTVTLASSSPSVAAVDSTTVTIPRNSYFSNGATWGPGVVGTAQLSASDARAAFYRYNTGTVNVSVITPTLAISSAPGTLGLGQYADNVYVNAPDYQAAALSVALSHTGTARAGTFANLTNTPITDLTVPQGSYYQYFRMAGLVRGTDTLVASATSPAHNPATVYTVVDSGRVDPLGNWPSAITAGDSVLVTLYARDPNGNVRNVVAATTFTLAPNANIAFHLGNAVVTQVSVPADAQFVQFYLKGVAAGAGSASISSATYRTYAPTVTVAP